MIESNLSPEEQLVAATAGSYRRIRNTWLGKEDKRGDHGVGPWCQDIEGAMAEMALAKHLKVYWSGQEKAGAGDVIGYEVRWTKYKSGKLLLHDDDKDDRRYALVTGELGKYVLRGWLLGKDGKKEERWGDPGHNKRECFIIPQKLLHEL